MIPTIFGIVIGALFIATFWIGTVEMVYGACNAKDDDDFDEGGPWLIARIFRTIWRALA